MSDSTHLERPGLSRWGWSIWAGLPYGLAIARLLYEADPHHLAAFGRLWIALATGVVGVFMWWGLLWWAGHSTLLSHDRGLKPLVPAGLLWLHILAPPLDVNPARGVILLGGVTTLIAAVWLYTPARQDIKTQHAVPLHTVIVGATALVAYLLTMQRTVGRADTFEFQVTAPVLGVAHPTGYPLYILLGKVFSLLPLGKVATRVNLTSAVAATLAVVVVYEVLRRALKVDGITAALAALAFGLSPTFWSQAVIAEVYALHNLFVAAILGLAVWLVVSDGDGRAERAVLTLLALIGLSLTNHLTTVLLLPAVAVALLLAWPRLTWKRWALAAGLLAAGLLVYAYIPIRWPALHDGHLMRFDEFIGWVTGSRFGGALQLRAWLDDPTRWGIVARLALDQYGWPGVILAVMGLGLMVWRERRAALVTGLAFAAFFFYGLNYLVPDISVFLIPMFLIGAIWMGYGVGVIVLSIGARYAGTQYTAWLQTLPVALFALLPLSAAWTTGPTFDWSAERELEAWGRSVLSLPLDEGSAILADGEKIAPLEYLHRIEGLRPDMDMVVLGTEEEYYAHLYARLDRVQTVYLARLLPNLEGSYHLRSVGPLVEVGTEPLLEPPALTGEPVGWENGITLLGHRIDGKQVQIGDQAHLTLYWRVDEAISQNYQVRLRLVDRGGDVVWQGAPAYAVSNRYPTGAWKAGEVVPDYHAIPLAYTIPEGDYSVQAALAAPFSDEPVPLESGDGWAEVATIEVEGGVGTRHAPTAGRRTAVAFDGGALVGIDAPEQAPAGGTIQVAAGWKTELAERWTESTLTTDGDDWDEFVFETPQSEIDVWIRLRLRLDASGALVLFGMPMRCGWLRPVTDACRVAMIRIEGEAVEQAIANFDDQILLSGVSFEAGRIERGGALSVTLEWQALRQPDADYTVFVQLIGPDGRPHGQVDQWPVQGTFPTSTWEPGQQVIDSYLVPLDFDAPPGSYQLHVGLYLLSTNTRLLVLDDEGKPIGDHVTFEGLIVPE